MIGAEAYAEWLERHGLTILEAAALDLTLEICSCGSRQCPRWIVTAPEHAAIRLAPGRFLHVPGRRTLDQHITHDYPVNDQPRLNPFFSPQGRRR